MKIMGNMGVYNSYDKNSNKSTKEKSLAANNKNNKDKVEISNKAINKNVKNTEVEYLKNSLSAMEDREARLADLKSRISAGTYNVSSEDVANAILESKKV